MNIHFGKQSQFELFPGTTGGDPIENTAPRFIFSRIIMTFDNLVVVLVLVIVGLIIAFSVGVDRGRRTARVAKPVAQIAAPVLASSSVMPSQKMDLMTDPVVDNRSISSLSGAAQAARSVQLPASVPVLTVPASVQKDIDKGYTVQVASYKKGSLAEKEAGDLKRQGFASFVMPKGNFSIVCVGKYSSANLAKPLQAKLKKRYKDCMIRSF